MIQWDDTAVHASDADLVRFMDGECSPAQEHDLRRHLRECTSCHERLDLLVRTSARLSDALAAPDTHGPPPPKLRGPWRFLKRGAALIATLGVLVLVAGPVLGWLSGRSARESAPAVVISFVPRGNVFTIELPNHQAEGTLTLVVDTVNVVTVRVVGPGPSPELMVLSDGLRIGNAAQSPMSYEVILPAQLGEVHVVVEGTLVLRRRVSPDAAAWEIRLSPR